MPPAQSAPGAGRGGNSASDPRPIVRRKVGVVIRKAGRPRAPKRASSATIPRASRVSTTASLSTPRIVRMSARVTAAPRQRSPAHPELLRQRLQHWLPEVPRDDRSAVWSRHQSQPLARFFESQPAHLGPTQRSSTRPGRGRTPCRLRLRMGTETLRQAVDANRNRR
jgi:hypothetical protein